MNAQKDKWIENKLQTIINSEKENQYALTSIRKTISPLEDSMSKMRSSA
jgi:hypothetical protein